MKKNIQIIFVLLTIILNIFFYNTGCKKDRARIYFLKEKDREWNPYKNGEMLFFINNLGIVDTYDVSVNNRIVTPIPMDERHFRDGYEYIGVVLKSKLTNTGAGITISASKDNGPASIGLYMNHKSGNPFSATIGSLDSIVTLNINGTYYYNTISVYRDTSEIDSLEISKYYFEKSKGFLRHEYKYGEYWQLK